MASARPPMVAGLVAIVTLAASCSTQGPAEENSLQLICGVENVEDMVELPDSPWIIGSGIGDRFFQGGALHLINEENLTASGVTLNLSGDLQARPPYDQCPGPVPADKFSAHGLSLVANPNGTYSLYVVNHGGRESIEVFEVARAEGEPSFTWIGCVPTPETAMSNSVAARADSSIVLSASGAADFPLPSFSQLASNPPDMSAAGGEQTGLQTGAVFIWTRDAGWKKVPNSELAANNGIELSKDGKWAFANAYSGESMTHLPLDPSLGESRTVQFDFKPDNIRWAQDGTLVATGQIADAAKVAACVMEENADCAIDYTAAAIDPQSLEVTPLYTGEGTQDFGTATIGLKTADALWLGSVHSHCIARLPLADEE